MHKRTVGIGNKKRDLKFVFGPENVLTHLRAGAFSRSVCVNKLFSFFLSGGGGFVRLKFGLRRAVIDEVC